MRIGSSTLYFHLKSGVQLRKFDVKLATKYLIAKENGRFLMNAPYSSNDFFISLVESVSIQQTLIVKSVTA